MITYEATGNEITSGFIVGSLYILYCMITVIIIGIIDIKTDLFSYNIRELKTDINNLKHVKIDLRESKEKLNKYIDKFSSMINEDIELRKKFNEIYEENKYLLDNPSELYERINNMEALNTGKAFLKKMKDTSKGVKNG